MECLGPTILNRVTNFIELIFRNWIVIKWLEMTHSLNVLCSGEFNIQKADSSKLNYFHNGFKGPEEIVIQIANLVETRNRKKSHFHSNCIQILVMIHHLQPINFHKFSSFVQKQCAFEKGEETKFSATRNALIKRDSPIYCRTFIQIKCIWNFFSLSLCPNRVDSFISIIFLVKMKTNMNTKLIIIWVFSPHSKRAW